MSDSPVTAPHLWAMTHGHPGGCMGNFRCHYCGGPCTDELIHPEPAPSVRRFLSGGPEPSRCPSSPYMCKGCAHWRRGACTASFLGGGFLDRQRPFGWGWLVNRSEAKAISSGSARRLWEQLLDPPCTFFLALRTCSGPAVRLDAQKVNDHAVVSAQTELSFTVDNVEYTYTPYDAMQAVRSGESHMAGVRALVELMGRPPQEFVPESEQPRDSPKRGRPPMVDPRETTARSVLRKSG
jgi:hypothetical protein